MCFTFIKFDGLIADNASTEMHDIFIYTEPFSVMLS